jgi:DNA-binding CsgD family transcriptional regulator
MYLYERIIKAIQKRFRRMFKRNFFLDVDTLHAVKIVAAREKREPEEMASQILKDVLRGHQEQEENWTLWETLSPREKDITALICLDYTTRQIAAKLHISPETVKTHAEKILFKFDLHSRNELRRMLKDWDFIEWER